MSRLAFLLEICIVLLVLTGVYSRNISSPSFHSDESQWIATSYYFELFVQADFASPEWETTYWTLTQPPLTRYTIALGRLAGGYHEDDLNTPWKGGLSREENEAKGAIPTSELLWWSRLPMAFLAIFTGMLLFLAATSIGGRVAGYGTLLFFVATPYLLKMLGRAMGEAPLLFWTVLAAGCAVFALHYWQKRRGLWWLVAVGVCSGLAGSAKLNGIAIAGTAVMSGIFVFVKYRQNLSKEGKRFIGMALFVTPLIAVLTFFLLNPFLYTSPIQHLSAMWEHRTEAIQNQQVGSPDKAVLDLETRLQVVPKRIFVSYTPTQIKVPLLNMLITAVGLTYLVWLGKRWFTTRSDPTWSQTVALVLLSAAFFMVIPSLATPINFERYFLFPVIFNVLCTALCVAVCWKIGVRVFQARSRMEGEI